MLRQRCGDPHGARDAYLRAILCQADDSHGIPSEQRKEYLDIPYLKKIPEEQILSELKEEAFYIGPNVTVAYNLARLAEEQRQDKLAEQMYKKCVILSLLRTCIPFFFLIRVSNICLFIFVLLFGGYASHKSLQTAWVFEWRLNLQD